MIRNISVVIFLIILMISSCSKDGELPENDVSLTKNDINIEYVKLNYNLVGIDFLNNDLGFAIESNGKIIKTINSGSTWEVLYTSHLELIDLQFIDENLGFVIGKNQDNFFLLNTADGGLTFEEILIPEGQELTKLLFTNSNIGFIIGFDTVLKTVNGGRLWTKTALDFNIYSDIFKTNDNEMLLCGLNGTLLKSTNYGNDWSEINLNTTSHIYEIKQFENTYFLMGQSIIKTNFSKTQEFSMPANFNGAQVFDNTTILGFGYLFPELGYFQDGAIYISNDSGKTWETIIYSEFNRINTVDFIDSKNGFGIADDFFLKTQFLLKFKISK